ncbi:MAG: RNA-binding protein [Clostridium sp. SCN 57-10]|nr:MAG: RNA-binding protein [Clostridium sp. SCN 57-10]
MLTSKQRAQLRGLANGIDTIMQIGKDGVTESVIRQAQESIGVRELIKVRVLETAMLTPREACEQICAAIGAEPVQCIGTRFVMYKRNAEKPAIELVK